MSSATARMVARVRPALAPPGSFEDEFLMVRSAWDQILASVLLARRLNFNLRASKISPRSAPHPAFCWPSRSEGGRAKNDMGILVLGNPAPFGRVRYRRRGHLVLVLADGFHRNLLS